MSVDYSNARYYLAFVDYLVSVDYCMDIYFVSLDYSVVII